MTDTIDWQIPPSVLQLLECLPQDRSVAFLIRHSVREDLPDGDAAYSLPITESGVQLGRQLGSLLGERLCSLHTSPLNRCVQTAEALQAGAEVDLPIIHSRLLGDPGAFVIDGKLAWSNWENIGNEGVMSHLVSAIDPLPGMARPVEAARFLVRNMLAIASDCPGIHVFVTHDSLVTATAARLLDVQLGQDSWPRYLEGAFFWIDDNQVHTAYRSYQKSCSVDSFITLSEEHVIEFARREIAATVGFDSGARFFLAGGAFKSLLTGRAPRDIDLWAPSIHDRNLLLQALDKRGARRLADKPFADVFKIADRIVEIPYKVEPETLDERLANFDLALSAIGVEHRGDGSWVASIHPLALTSIKERDILLLKPRVNWKYALTTLERMRRYAHELGFVSSTEEENEVWKVFESQLEDTRSGMIDRHKRTCLGGFNVLKEAEMRHRALFKS